MLLGFPGSSAGKESACNAGDPWVRKIPWRRDRLPTPIFLPGEFHGQRRLAGTVHGFAKESNTTGQLTLSNTYRENL